MCVAGLNVSTQACHHRWYELIRSCSDEHDLSNCPSKLQLEGWESRKEACPWCDSRGAASSSAEEQLITESTHRLFGSTSSASSSASSSPTLSAAGRPQVMRCDTDSALSTLSRTGSFSSVGAGSERGQRHRQQNDRFRQYLTMLPHEILPSARKNYPDYAPASPSITSASSLVSDAGSTKSGKRTPGTGWKKSMRFGRSMFASF